MDFEAVAQAVEGVPVMAPSQGRRVYDHIRETRAAEILELGTAHGVSAAYMAAAVAANGTGHVTTVDSDYSDYDPSPPTVLARANLTEHVTLVRRPYSTYTWFLKEVIEERSDAAGNCEPLYDFCYLDGAHDWHIDGLAVMLVEKLLKPEGWLLLDDIDWHIPPDTRQIELRLSEPERVAPPMKVVWDLLVRQHPSFTTFRLEDAIWGWARKAPGEPRHYSVETTRSVGAVATAGMRRMAVSARAFIRSPRRGR
jgi:predicted O-methyltransferase YrrM